MKKLFSTRYSENAVSFSLLLLRLAAGGLIIPHGFDKLIHFVAKAKEFPDPLHVGSVVSLSLVIFAEFFCAFLLVAGLMTRLVVIPLLITMAVAVFIIHHGDVLGEGEHAALYLAAYIALLFTGPGKVSLDRMLGN
ncbi:MAG: DoxX family protein [Chitinophagia bacterium]|jgi:putative oxidoreductase|nr:DoxX family protein [Chitinophagia bacterium]